jgi:hypothetical protein
LGGEQIRAEGFGEGNTVGPTAAEEDVMPAGAQTPFEAFKSLNLKAFCFCGILSNLTTG